MDDETTQMVAGEVRAWLARRQRSGRSVAQELGWTEIYLNRRIRGIVPFAVTDLARLARLLDVPVTAFFESPSATGSRTGYIDQVSPAEALGAAA